jgi:hypothetical protein
VPVLLAALALLGFALVVILLNPFIPRDWGGALLCEWGIHGGPFTKAWLSGWKCTRCGTTLPDSDFFQDHK